MTGSSDPRSTVARALALGGVAMLFVLVALHALFSWTGGYVREHWAELGLHDSTHATELSLFGPLLVDVTLGSVVVALGAAAARQARRGGSSVVPGVLVLLLGGAIAILACCFGSFVLALGLSFAA